MKNPIWLGETPHRLLYDIWKEWSLQRAPSLSWRCRADGGREASKTCQNKLKCGKQGWAMTGNEKVCTPQCFPWRRAVWNSPYGIGKILQTVTFEAFWVDRTWYVHYIAALCLQTLLSTTGSHLIFTFSFLSDYLSLKQCINACKALSILQNSTKLCDTQLAMQTVTLIL